MKKLLVLVLCTLLFSASLNAQSVRSFGTAQPNGFDYNPSTIKILSWNVEHFVDEFDDPYVNNGRENNPNPQMDGKEALLAEAIKKADADIVVLQEFESSSYLQRIADKHFPEMGYRFFAGNESDTWYMNVVVMSKVPLGTLYSYGSLYTPVPSITTEEGELETQINLNTRMWSVDVLANANYEFVLTGVHLKAGRSERDVQMRLGQINFLKGQFSRFLKEDKKTNIVMMGDFNSLPESIEMEVLLAGKRGNKFFDPIPNNVFSHSSKIPTRRLDYMIFNTNMMKEVVACSAKVEYILTVQDMVKLSDHLPIISLIETADK